MNEFVPERTSFQPRQQESEGLAFVQNQNGDAKNANAEGKKTNKDGQSDCFHCGGGDHWVSDCPQLTPEQKEKLAEDRKKKKETKEGQSHVQIACGEAVFAY